MKCAYLKGAIISIKTEDLTFILLCAGSSKRFKGDRQVPKKQWLRIGKKPLWLHTVQHVKMILERVKIILVFEQKELAYAKKFGDFTFVAGGHTRQKSLKNALVKVQTPFVMVSDSARFNLDERVLKDLMQKISDFQTVVPFLSMSDTVVLQGKTVNREDIKLVQTPQISQTIFLRNALENEVEFSDESSLIAHFGGLRGFVRGSEKLHKITYIEDLKRFDLPAPCDFTCVGSGVDVHRFNNTPPAILGGCEVSNILGFESHSDGDVLAHALCDAILGAIGAGDIGEWFPDHDNKYKNADSMLLLTHLVGFVRDVGFELVNVDISILAQKLRIQPHKKNICENVARALNIDEFNLNIKATTTEKLGFLGRNEGLMVQATVCMNCFDWRKYNENFIG